MGDFEFSSLGHSGPITSPLYRVPMQVKNATHLLFHYEANRDAVAAVLPPDCDLSEGPSRVWVLVQVADEYPMPYAGTYIFPECVFEGKTYAF